MPINPEDNVSPALRRWLEVAPQGVPDLPQAQLQTVFAGSEFVAHTLTREIDWLRQGNAGLFQRELAAGELRSLLQADLQGLEDEAGLERALRRFRNRQMARILWRDLGGLASLDQTLADLSELADACISGALDLLTRWACERDGVPRDAKGREQSLVVLGMGKLGARELNMSSDIDLVFCFPEHGHADGRRRLENEAFFTRLGRRLVNVLSRQTVDGFVFRVDMRLRPFGEAGPLVVSFGAMEQYLFAQAREWERYAMVKARPITGQADHREVLQQLITAFVYRRYIDFGAIESIRDMKQLIERELHKKGMEDNIKLGRGGIREIEFIGQALQLVRGGRDHELQIRPIQQVLSLLGDKQLLPDFAVRELLAAYRFLRLAENRLQGWQDRQTHVLPQQAEARERLALSMGEPDWEAFAAVLEGHRQNVQSQFELVFEAPQAEESEGVSPLDAVWQHPEQDERAQALLSAAGFREPAPVLKALNGFRDGAAVRTLSARARSRLDRLMSLVLHAVAACERAQITLSRLLSLFEAVLRRTAYIDLLVENPMALSQLLRLLGESAWVGSQLAHQPILLDELLDPRSLYSPVRREELRSELATLLASVDEGDQEQELQRLRQFAQGNRLRVAAADITDALPLMVVSDYLTDIAEVSVQQVQQSAWRDISARHGRPSLGPDFDQGFAVIGYGKFGGIELGYGSDLDLVFLHASDNPSAVTDGPRELANDVFYARLGQRMIHMLTTRLPSGQLYEIDMRLRPNGKSGMLVSSLKAFDHYQQNEAWTWEHQALVRARAVSGDPQVIRRFARIRHQILCRERDPELLRRQVKEMRAKMAAQLDRSDDALFDIKQGSGGLVDIEFLVQYAVLWRAHQHPGVTEWTDNARLLQRLAEYRLLPDQDAERLFSAYRVYRSLVHRRTLQERPAQVAQSELREERATVGEVWRRLMD